MKEVCRKENEKIKKEIDLIWGYLNKMREEVRCLQKQ